MRADDEPGRVPRLLRDPVGGHEAGRPGAACRLQVQPVHVHLWRRAGQHPAQVRGGGGGWIIQAYTITTGIRFFIECQSSLFVECFISDT